MNERDRIRLAQLERHTQRDRAGRNVPYTTAINVVDKGADPAGVLSSSLAIEAAMSDAALVGGSRVDIPAGTYLLRTRVFFQSNTQLNILPGVTLVPYTFATTTATTAVAGALSIVATNGSGFIAGDALAIELDNGTYHFPSISVAPVGNTITFAPAIPAGRTATAGLALKISWVDRGLLNITNVSNVSITGGVLDGLRSTNTQMRLFGVRIDGGVNIDLEDMHIKNMAAQDSLGVVGGDGVLVTGASANVNIIRCLIENCVRQGISVISCDGFLIQGNTIKDITGKSPGAAIDLEPDSIAQIVKNGRILGNHFDNCWYGVLLAPTGQIPPWRSAVYNDVAIAATTWEMDDVIGLSVGATITLVMNNGLTHTTTISTITQFVPAIPDPPGPLTAFVPANITVAAGPTYLAGAGSPVALARADTTLTAQTLAASSSFACTAVTGYLVDMPIDITLTPDAGGATTTLATRIATIVGTTVTTLNAVTTGYKALSGAAVAIARFSGNNVRTIEVQGNTFSRIRTDGVFGKAFDVGISDNTFSFSTRFLDAEGIARSGRYAIFLAQSDGASVKGNQCRGLLAAPNAQVGVFLLDCMNVDVTDNSISNQASQSILVDGRRDSGSRFGSTNILIENNSSLDSVRGNVLFTAPVLLTTDAIAVAPVAGERPFRRVTVRENKITDTRIVPAVADFAVQLAGNILASDLATCSFKPNSINKLAGLYAGIGEAETQKFAYQATSGALGTADGTRLNWTATAGGVSGNAPSVAAGGSAEVTITIPLTQSSLTVAAATPIGGLGNDIVWNIAPAATSGQWVLRMYNNGAALVATAERTWTIVCEKRVL